MTPDRHNRVKDLFETARARPPREQLQFLEASCADDPSIHQEVASLLSAYQKSQSLEPPAPDSSGAGLPIDDPLIGRQIGPYRLVRILGYGGMGTVYEAVQDEPKRQVAIKVVRGHGYVDQNVIRLFRREVQALALLNHPHIASLYESGRTEDGRHYFAMELVPGKAVIEFARKNKLSTEQKLELFGSICDAIAYAHQRGVIHRDIKPSNLLVTESGLTKVLDFGLAKITDSDVALTTLSTDAAKIQGTLAYMSPEQARGASDQIDLRSDIYSLGVVLYELLTDQLPYDVRTAALPHAVRLICDEPPRRPSTIHKTLRGDLETVCLKALEKEPSHRYQSVQELAGDLRRFCDGQPIVARPHTAAYQLKKLILRHKIATVGLAAVFLIVLVFAGTVTALYRQSQSNLVRAVSAEDEARAEARESSETTEYLLQLFLNPTPDAAEIFRTVVQASILPQSARIRLMAMTESRREILLTRLAETGPSEEIAYGICNLGFVLQGLDEPARAIEVLERSLDVCGKSARISALAIARTKRVLAQCYHSLKRSAEAETLMRESLALRRRELGEESVDTLEALQMLSFILNQTGKSEEAEAGFRRVIQRKEVLYGKQDPCLAFPLVGLGDSLRHQGDPAAAELCLRRAVELRERDLPHDHYYVLLARSNLGMALMELGKFEEAEPMLLAYFSQYMIRKPWTAAELQRMDWSYITQFYERWGKPEKAAEWRARYVTSTQPARPGE